MFSTHACASRSLASRSARSILLFSRWVHSASTRNPRRSSKDSCVVDGCCCWSAQAAAMPSSRIVFIFSRVGSVSKTSLLSVVVVTPAYVLVHERQLRGCGLLGRRDPVEAMLQDRLDVPVRARPGGQRPRARRLQPVLAVALGQPQDPQA